MDSEKKLEVLQKLCNEVVEDVEKQYKQSEQEVKIHLENIEYVAQLISTTKTHHKHQYEIELLGHFKNYEDSLSERGNLSYLKKLVKVLKE